jgi:peptidoglycan/LPS O-acetylase OafA/YrhL
MGRREGSARERPSGLQREAGEPEQPSGWALRHAAGLVCAVLGLAAIAVASILCFGGDEIQRIPDVRVSMPFLVGVLAAAIVSLVRREGAYALPIGGVALAGAAMVLGWALVVGVIAVITAVIILVMQELM